MQFRRKRVYTRLCFAKEIEVVFLGIAGFARYLFSFLFFAYIYDFKKNVKY